MTRTLLVYIATAFNMFSQSCVLAGLSPALFDRYHSVALASVAYATIWLPAIFVVPLAPWYSVRFEPAKLYIVGELAGAAVLTLAAFSFGPSPVLSLALLTLRGLLSTVTYTCATLYIKQTAKPDRVQGEIGYFETSRLVGSLIAAAFGWMTFDVANFLQICLVSAVAAVLGLIVAAFWPQDGRWQSKAPASRSAQSRWRDLSFVPMLGLLIMTEPLLAYHHVAKTPLAMDYLHLGASGVATIILVNTTSVTIGAWIASYAFSKRPRRPSWLDVLLAIVSAAFMISTPSLSNVVLCLLAYGAYLVVFEIWYTGINSALMADATPQQAATIVALKAAVMPAALLVCTPALGLVADSAGLSAAAATAAAAAVGGTALIAAGSVSRRGLRGLARVRLSAPGGDTPPSLPRENV